MRGESVRGKGDKYCEVITTLQRQKLHRDRVQMDVIMSLNVYEIRETCPEGVLRLLTACASVRLRDF